MPRSRCTVATRLIDSMYAAVRMFTLCCFDELQHVGEAARS